MRWSSVPVCPLRYVVSGAGVDSVNGEYEVRGFYNGALLFVLDNQEHGVTHYLFCTSPRLKVSKSSVWMICSSTEFPDEEHDVKFYTCTSTFLDGMLPTHAGWMACARESRGLAQLMQPPPSICGLVRSTGCVDVLTRAVLEAEMAEDARVSKLVDAHAAETASLGWECPLWLDAGFCHERFRTCRMRHSAGKRNPVIAAKCKAFGGDEGCYKSSYECNGAHNWQRRKTQWRFKLLRAVPTLVVEVVPRKPSVFSFVSPLVSPAVSSQVSPQVSPRAPISPRAPLVFA